MSLLALPSEKFNLYFIILSQCQYRRGNNPTRHSNIFVYYYIIRLIRQLSV